jgi:hypothetical protein
MWFLTHSATELRRLATVSCILPGVAKKKEQGVQPKPQIAVSMTKYITKTLFWKPEYYKIIIHKNQAMLVGC